MKYPRNTRIFRGQLDVAPVACVFFMTALLLFLHSSIVFTPGVRLDLHPNVSTNHPSLYIDSDDLFTYAGVRMSRSGFLKRLRGDVTKGRAPSTILFQTDPSASTNAVNDVRAIAAEFSIALEAPSTRIELPEIPDQPGTEGASVTVAVNLNGQFFYENQLVPDEKALEAKLTEAASNSREPLTLALRLDKAVAVETFVRLSEMARKAKFEHVIVATRPPLKPAESPIAAQNKP
jgi:biopolymer transport protein ExbD